MMILGIDSIDLKFFKQIKDWYKFKDKNKDDYLIFYIPVTKIERIEFAIYNDKKLYIWYVTKDNEVERVNIEFQDQFAAISVLRRLRYILKSYQR